MFIYDKNRSFYIERKYILFLTNYELKISPNSRRKHKYSFRIQNIFHTNTELSTLEKVILDRSDASQPHSPKTNNYRHKIAKIISDCCVVYVSMM